MQCFVYKGEHKEDHYLFLPNSVEDSDLATLPSALLGMLGALRLVTDFDLTPDRQLPQAQAKQVLDDISEQGFYLQMPKKDMLAAESDWINQ